MCRKPLRHQFTLDLEAAWARAHFAHIDNERAMAKHRRRGHTFNVGDLVVETRFPNVVCEVIAVSEPSPNEGMYVRFLGDHIEYGQADRYRRASRKQRRAHQATAAANFAANEVSGAAV